MLPSVSHSCGECGRRASALLPWLGPHILFSLFVSPARPELCLHTCPRDRLGHHSPNRRLPYFCPSPHRLLAAPPSGLAGFCLLSGPCLPRSCTLSPACRIWEPGAQHRGRPGLLCLLRPGGHPAQRGLPQPPGHRAACPPDHAGEVGGPAQTLPGKVLPPHSPSGTDSFALTLPRQNLASRVLGVDNHG